MQANKFQCQRCYKKFQHYEQLRKHGLITCKENICTNCGNRFRQARDLRRHQERRKHLECSHCDKTFCSNDHFQKHLRSIYNSVGGGAIDYDTPVNEHSGYEQDEDYQTILRQKIDKIRNYEKIRGQYKLINRQIDSSFTYRDLQKLLSFIYDRQGNAFKLNIGFGFILYNVVEDKYKYYYCSQNNMLFEKAVTITTREDLTSFLKRIADLDLATNYYLKKPSSSWVLAGLTNVEISITDMKDVPIGVY